MLKEMTREELEKRMSEIAVEIDDEEADLDALEEEAKEIKQELEERKTVETRKAEIRSKVALGAGSVVEKVIEERTEMPTNEEIRNSKEYINAFANYIKTNDDTECRTLLSENVDGVVPVPVYVEGRIRTAWENSGIMNLVKKTFIRGNIKIGFELSATGAVVHTEGSGPIEQEELTFGIVTMIPQSIKKWVQISDEALDLAGTEFLDYIYDELAYRIMQKAEEILIGLIANAPTEATATAVSVGEVSGDLTAATVIEALGLLNSEAANPVIVTTRANWSALKVAALNANYAIDPFQGLPVYFASEAAMSGMSMVVGDFGFGGHANFPNGTEMQIKVDDKTNMTADLVNILGRQFIALALVAEKAFVRVVAGNGGNNSDEG